MIPPRLRVAVGALLQESNPFAPIRTTLENFKKSYFEEGPDVVSRLRDSRIEVAGAVQVLEKEGCVVVPLLATHGGAGGIVTSECFEDLLCRLLDPLAAAGEVDGVYLALHGAMLVEGEFDAEGRILTRVRAIVGEAVPVAISCDLHANVTPAMIGLADIIVGYQTYPHMDTFETGVRAAALLVRTLRGEISPCLRMRKAPLQVSGVRQLTAGDYPHAEAFRMARAFEESGEALSVSYFAAFSKLDAPDTGWRAVAITDGAAAAADEIALKMVKHTWSQRHRFDVPLVPIATAIAKGLALKGGPIVLVDSSDVVGGGAVGDSAVVLKALHEAAVSGVTLVTDPETVGQAEGAGVGGRFRAAIGNKLSGDWYGEPIELDVTVRRLSDGRFTYRGGVMAGTESTMGPTALLASGDLQIVCCSVPTYEYADEQYLAAGADLKAAKFIVSKTAGNYTQGFPNAAAAFVLNTPGPTTPDQRSLPWKNVSRPLYPLDDNFEPDFEGYPASDIYRRRAVRSGGARGHGGVMGR